MGKGQSKTKFNTYLELLALLLMEEISIFECDYISPINVNGFKKYYLQLA